MPLKLDISIPSSKKKALEKENKEYLAMQKKLVHKEKTVEINEKTIMDALNRIESKLSVDQIPRQIKTEKESTLNKQVATNSSNEELTSE